MNPKAFFTFLLCLFSFITFAQTTTLKGKIITNEGAPLVGAHVQLIELKKGAFTNENGAFSIQEIPQGNYTMSISYIGYRTLEQKISISGSEIILENIAMEMLEDRLREVVVAAERQSQEVRRLPDVLGTYIIAGKKNEVISIADLNTNLSEKIGRQLFAKIPGAFVYDMDGSGNQVNIATRGLDPHRSWEFNVRQNGILTNSDMYGYPASHYSPPMEAIQKVELVRGTAALQYGAQFGGMVNYITKYPDTTKRVGFESINSVGSYGLFSSYNALGGKLGKWTYYTYYQKRVSDGYRDNSSSDASAQYAMLQYQANENLSLRAEFAHSTYLYQMPGPLTDSMFYANPRQSTRQRNYYSPNIYVPSITLDWKIGAKTHLNLVSSAIIGGRSVLTFVGFANVPDIIDPATDQYKNRTVDIDDFRSYTTELRLTQNYNIGSFKNTLATGIRYIHNNLRRRQQGKGTTGSDYDLSITGNWGRDLRYKTQNVAFFIENMLYVTPKFTINPGFRIENGSTDMVGYISYYPNDKVPLKIEHMFPLFGVNAQYKLNERNRFYAGWSQAYRPMILADVIPPTVLDVTDPNLEDASGYNLEAGVNGNLFQGALHYDLGIFQLQYNNRIGSLVLQDDNGDSYIFKTNTGDSRTQGVEAYIELRPMQLLGLYSNKFYLSVFSATSYFDAVYTRGNAVVNKENRDLEGNRLETVPRWMSRNGLQCWAGNFSAVLQYSYVDKSFADALNMVKPSANGGVGIVPAYGLLDFNTSLRFAERYMLRLSVNNITDEQYFTKRPTIHPGPGVWSSDGRSFVVTFGVKL
ncbi:MAG: TonB-dependent receptor [Saprospiraceae bacterium]|nr:TonB-dependent receptor [Saprospiraceae bacterium]